MKPPVQPRRRALLAAALPLLAALALAACQSAPPAPPPRFSAGQLAMFRELGFSQTEEGWELSFAEKLLFDFDAHKLNTQSRAAVGKVSAALLSVGIVHLRVEGHTDASGTARTSRSPTTPPPPAAPRTAASPSSCWRRSGANITIPRAVLSSMMDGLPACGGHRSSNDNSPVIAGRSSGY